MVFNIDSYVKVKLNDTGLAELRRQGEDLRKSSTKLGKYKPPKIDSDGYTKFQMHDLMNRLSHLCALGLEPPFHQNIIILK